jgi:hypothetical protein
MSIINVRPFRRHSSLIVVCTLHSPVDANFAGLHDFTADYHLVEDLVHLVEVENEIEFAHAAKVLVENLHEQVDEFEVGQLVVLRVHAEGKK